VLAAGWVRSGPPLLAQVAAGGVPGVLLGEGIAAHHQLETLAGVGLMAGLLAWQARRSASRAPAARGVARAWAVALAACLSAGVLTAGWYLGTVPA
jgi:CHASE2 domain-containing sensor protein